jgi:hypothetical protein
MSSESRDQTDKIMPKKVLQEHIIEFLKVQNMCVLATIGDGFPRATPIEYHSKGITIYFVGEPGTKLKNIAANPNVSIGIFLPYTVGKAPRVPKLREERKLSPNKTLMASEKAWKYTNGKKQRSS